MNCKPNDMAQVVKTYPPGFNQSECSKAWLGMTVKVRLQTMGGLIHSSSGIVVATDAWLLDELRQCPRCGKGLSMLPDELLKPLPPLGDETELDAKISADDAARRASEAARLFNSGVRVEDGSALLDWYTTLQGD